MYVFDSNAFSAIFHFYPKRFPTLWKMFEDLVQEEKITSVREALRELREKKFSEEIVAWLDDNEDIFHIPSSEEGTFVAEIFKVRHFQHSLEQKKKLKGGPFADPFIIARAKVMDFSVVTLEEHKPNAAKIPNICDHFKIPWMNLEEFMEKENWEF